MATHRQNFGIIASSSASGKRTAAPRSVCVARRFLALVAFAAVIPLAAHAADEVPRENPLAALPAFVFQPLHANNQGSVFGIYEARHADLVLVEGGFASGFQTGMVCQVADGEGEVGEIMLVEVRNNCSAALILQLEPGKIVEPGHSVRIKTVRF